MQAPTQMQMTAPTIKMIIRLPAPAVAAVFRVAVGASVGSAVGAGNVGTGTGVIVIDGAAVDDSQSAEEARLFERMSRLKVLVREM